MSDEATVKRISEMFKKKNREIIGEFWSNRYFHNHGHALSHEMPPTAGRLVSDEGEVEVWMCDYCGALTPDIRQHTLWHEGEAEPLP